MKNNNIIFHLRNTLYTIIKIRPKITKTNTEFIMHLFIIYLLCISFINLSASDISELASFNLFKPLSILSEVYFKFSYILIANISV
jgi:hypothetical protein